MFWYNSGWFMGLSPWKGHMERRDFLKGAAFFGAAAVPLARAAAESVVSVERPVLRVAIMSDIQGYPYPEDAGMRNLERALDVLAPFKPDVVLNDGDINDTGRDADAVAYYKARCDARLGKIRAFEDQPFI